MSPGAAPTIMFLMAVHFDVSELAAAVGKLQGHPNAKKLAIVVPIAEGQRETVRAFLAEGPPFDLAGAGIDRHEVFLTEDEVIFVFGAPDGLPTLERILAEPEFWDVVSSWERIVSAPPRAADIIFDWSS